jgi:hypothetical protein
MPRAILTIEDVQLGGHTLYAVCRNAGCRHVKKVDLPLLLKHVDAQTSLMPGPHERHFTDAMRCTACRWRGVHLWVEPVERKSQVSRPSAPVKLPNFEIVNSGPAPFNQSDVIGTADNLMVGRGAYAAAALFYPDKRIILKQGAFVVEDSKSGKPVQIMTRDQFTEMREMERNMSYRSIPSAKRS